MSNAKKLTSGFLAAALIASTAFAASAADSVGAASGLSDPGYNAFGGGFALGQVMPGVPTVAPNTGCTSHPAPLPASLPLRGFSLDSQNKVIAIYGLEDIVSINQGGCIGTSVMQRELTKTYDGTTWSACSSKMTGIAHQGSSCSE